MGVDFSGATSQVRAGQSRRAQEQAPTWPWCPPCSEHPEGSAPVLTTTISKELCHVNLHKAYFLGQARNQNSFKEDETLNTCCWGKKNNSPKASSRAWYSYKHLLPFQFFLLLKTKESVSRSLEQLSLLSHIHSNMTHIVGLWMGKCCIYQNRHFFLSLIFGQLQGKDVEFYYHVFFIRYFEFWIRNWQVFLLYFRRVSSTENVRCKFN